MSCLSRSRGWMMQVSETGLSKVDHGVQEFDLATRTSDAAAQLAVLERCQALPQFLPEHFCKLAAQAEAAGGGGSHSAAGKAALAAALRLMLRQAPQPYPAIAQVAAWQSKHVPCSCVVAFTRCMSLKPSAPAG